MLSEWTYRNLAVQGYCLTADETRGLRIGVRFSTGVCLPLVITGLALESAPLPYGVSAIGLVAGFTPRHPFDLIWNRAVRHLSGAPELPANPRRRRDAFKVGTAWLLALATLLATGNDGLALGLGVPLLAACALVTTANFCVPWTILQALEHRIGARAATT